MDTTELQKLAGIIKEASSETHYSAQKMGQFGNIAVVEGESATFIAKLLGVKPNWKLTKLKSGWAAYDGERLTFFDHQADFEEE